MLAHSQTRRPRVALALAAAGLLSGCARRADLLGSVTPFGDGAVFDRFPDALPGFHGPRFTPPQLVAALADPGSDEDPTFTGDLLELYFMSTRGGTRDIWVSRRAASTDPWGAPALVPELSTPTFIESAPSVSLDGLTIWFATDREPMRGWLWVASRGSRSAPWGAAAPVAELASPFFDTSPSVDATETTMFFTSSRSGNTGFDLYFTTRASVGSPWDPPLPLPGLATPADDTDPFVAQGGLVIYYASTRANGQADLFWSARRSTDAPFPPPFPLIDLNSPAYDSDPTLSQDLLYMMFSSARSGNTEIYETHAVN